MKIAGILFLVLGLLALIHSIYTLLSDSTIGRGSNVPFIDNGSPLVAVFFLLTAAALLYVYREKKVK